MLLKNNKLYFSLFIFLSIISLLLSFNSYCFAQEGTKNQLERKPNKANDKGNDKDTDIIDNAIEADDTTDEGQEEPQAQEQTEQKAEKHSTAYLVLGRELTKQEKDLYADLGANELKDELLHKEQRLVVVRALLAVGEGDSIKEVLAILPISKLKTFTELVNDFTEYTEKYGSVLEGIQEEFVYNIKDDEQAFKAASAKAYETVFGVPKDKQNTSEIISFLKENEALTYSRMLEALMNQMTPELKKQMLFNALDEIGRSDLKNNNVFVEKILAQKFTHKNLKKLLKELAPKKK